MKENPNNPRLIRDDKFERLVQSIREFPEMLEVRPIVVNPDNVALGGNMRLRASMEAGLKEVPVIVVDWDETKQNEFIIKDNIGFGDWDWDMLANEWDSTELEAWGLDVWTDRELEGLFDMPEDDGEEANEGDFKLVLTFSPAMGEEIQELLKNAGKSPENAFYEFLKREG